MELTKNQIKEFYLNKPTESRIHIRISSEMVHYVKAKGLENNISYSEYIRSLIADDMIENPNVIKEME